MDYIRKSTNGKSNLSEGACFRLEIAHSSLKMEVLCVKLIRK